MLREIVNKLSGVQITMITLAAILVPGAVSAGITFQPVAIVDATAGFKAAVDNGNKLHVFDPIAGYRNNPANTVEIVVSNGGANTCQTAYDYPVPAGKALVVTAITGYFSQYVPTINYSGFTVYDGAVCSGHVVAASSSSVNSSGPTAPVSQEFGVGLVMKAGKTVSVKSYNNFGFTFIHGYLVPSAAAPVATGVDAMAEPRSVTAADADKKTKASRL